MKEFRRRADEYFKRLTPEQFVRDCGRVGINIDSQTRTDILKRGKADGEVELIYEFKDYCFSPEC